MAGKYDPDVPTWPDPNSREAAEAAKAHAPYRRKVICWRIGCAPDALSCWDFCEGTMRGLGHGGVSGTISGLVKWGLLHRGPKKKNGHGKNEFTYRLNPTLRTNWSSIEWDAPLKDIAEKWGLV